MGLQKFNCFFVNMDSKDVQIILRATTNFYFYYLNLKPASIWNLNRSKFYAH
jgi:hypothetical protein